MKFSPYLFAVLSCIQHVSGRKASKSLGCFSGPGAFENQGSFTFQSVGYCIDLCDKASFNYAALQSDDCWCGNADPVQADLTSDKTCDSVCAGYATDICGGDDAWSIYAIGGASPDWLSSTTTGASTRTSTLEIVTASLSTTSSSTSSTSSTSTSSPTSSESPAELTSKTALTSSASSSHSASSTPALASTSVEPTPTTNGASRRFNILF
ncbi:hypothetical protein BJX76DRAFT_357746 [Aspergillus varians]